MTIDSENFWMSAASLLIRISTIDRILPMRHIKLAVYLSLAIASVGFGQPTYTIQEIPPVGGYDITASARINGNGTVAGWLEGPNGDARPIIFRNGVTTQMGGGIKGFGFGINDSDFLVGQGFFNPRGSDGAFFTQSSAINLGANRTGLQFVSSTAYGINDSSLIVGVATRSRTQEQVAVRFEGRSVTELPNPAGSWPGASAKHINGSGVVVGSVNNNGTERAVRWFLNNQLTVLDSQNQNAAAYSINDTGNATGYVADQVALWLGDTLNLLGKIPSSAKSFGLDINESNMIVGQFDLFDGTQGALLYQNGQLYDLQQRVVNGAGWDLLYANGINNLGQIVGVGKFNGKTRAFLLTPQ